MIPQFSTGRTYINTRSATGYEINNIAILFYTSSRTYEACPQLCGRSQLSALPETIDDLGI
jgi:hypothetical protein